MNLLFAVALLLSAFQPLSACGDHKHHVQHLRATLIKKMGMSEHEIRQVNQTLVAKAVSHVPLIENHEHPEHHEIVYLFGKEEPELVSNERVISFSNKILSRTPISTTLSLSLGPFPNYNGILVEVYARSKDEDEESQTTLMTAGAALDQTQPAMFAQVLSKELVEKWYSDDSKSVVISIVARDAETEDVINEKKLINNAILSFELPSLRPRNRRQINDEYKCKTNNGTNEECCVMSRIVTAQELNLPNLISPSTFTVNMCIGQCTKVESFRSLFSNINRQHVTLEPKGACCHAAESEHLDFVFTNAAGEIQSQKIWELHATKCICD